ncbi:hypothetical protein ABK040_006034 [Willaertia magna]
MKRGSGHIRKSSSITTFNSHSGSTSSFDFDAAEAFDESYVLAVVGNGAVGKSCLTVKYIQNIFIKEYDPTIEDKYKKRLKIGLQTVQLEILDTAGQEEYVGLEDNYFRQADGFLLVYSVDCKESFKRVKNLYHKILLIKDRETFPMVLCANKCDITSDRKITSEQGILLAKELGGIPYVETSAKLGLNVGEAFSTCLTHVRKYSSPTKQKEKKDLYRQSKRNMESTRSRSRTCNIL